MQANACGYKGSLFCHSLHMGLLPSLGRGIGQAEQEGLSPLTLRMNKEIFVRVLVIDDSRAMRALLGNILKGAGFTVFEGANGKDGLERLRQLEKVDLVLVDWNMPEMSGIEFLRVARAETAYDGIPIVMVTTETEMDRVQTALEAGANEYIMKPFTKQILLNKLELLGVAQS